jgi:hypothetical protein
MFKPIALLTLTTTLFLPLSRGMANPLFGKTVTVSYVNHTRLSGGPPQHIHRGQRGSINSKSEAVRNHSVSVDIHPDGTASLEQGQRNKIRVNGRIMDIDLIYENGVTLIHVMFDSSFHRCQASVIHGKQAGSATYRAGKFDVVSSRATDIQCSISG